MGTGCVSSRSSHESRRPDARLGLSRSLPHTLATAFGGGDQRCADLARTYARARERDRPISRAKCHGLKRGPRSHRRVPASQGQSGSAGWFLAAGCDGVPVGGVVFPPGVVAGDRSGVDAEVVPRDPDFAVASRLGPRDGLAFAGEARYPPLALPLPTIVTAFADRTPTAHLARADGGGARLHPMNTNSVSWDSGRNPCCDAPSLS